MSLRKKWTYLQKDPTKATKDSNILVTAQWGLLNHLPPTNVEYVVTDKVLEYDAKSCAKILDKILDEKMEEEKKLKDV